MAKVKVNVEEFSELMIFLLGMFVENPDLAAEPVQDFLSKTEHIKPFLKKVVRELPQARRKFKIIKSVFDFDENEIATIQIVPEGMKESREEKYLTRKKPYNINEVIKRHMNKEKKLYG